MLLRIDKIRKIHFVLLDLVVHRTKLIGDCHAASAFGHASGSPTIQRSSSAQERQEADQSKVAGVAPAYAGARSCCSSSGAGHIWNAATRVAAAAVGAAAALITLNTLADWE